MLEQEKARETSRFASPDHFRESAFRTEFSRKKREPRRKKLLVWADAVQLK